jgi:hypothetical protein
MNLDPIHKALGRYLQHLVLCLAWFERRDRRELKLHAMWVYRSDYRGPRYPWGSFWVIILILVLIHPYEYEFDSESLSEQFHFLITWFMIHLASDVCDIIRILCRTRDKSADNGSNSSRRSQVQIKLLAYRLVTRLWRVFFLNPFQQSFR